jgi:hypothetical protein
MQAVEVPQSRRSFFNPNPPVSSVDEAYAETGPEVVMHRRLLVTREVEHTQLTNGHLLPGEVDVELDVFSSPMMNRILGHVDR